jgi:adenylate cyclase
VLGLGWWLWTTQSVVLPVALPLSQVATLFLGLSLLGYLAETRSKNAINRLFGQYVPPELVNEMNDDPGNYSMSARSTELTVMFADVRGFTTLSERMEPAALAELMNQLLTELSRVIRADHMGTIDKYIGDCVMAFWGAPIPRADHAAAAVSAALGMQKALTALVPRLVVPEGAHIAVGIGVNTGRAVVGNMGSAYRMAYTVLGDAVNTASRLEGLTKAYGAAVVVGDSVRQAAPDDFLWCELDRVRVKGRLAPLAIHEPLCAAAAASDELRAQVQAHEGALAAYRERRFEAAVQAWQQLQAAAPSVLHELWLERAQNTLSHPPAADWDGVYTFETK